MRKVLTTLLVAGWLAQPAAAQGTETLADIRQDLTMLWQEVQSLRRELSTTGGATPLAGSATTLDRINAIEAELTRVTALAEELQFRVDRVVSDGTNRIGDLEFRLCELEPECDIALLGDTPTLGGSGGVEMPAPDLPITIETPATPDLALAEEQDFAAADAALQEGDYARAAELLSAFASSYPGSPLEVQANLSLGTALSGLERHADAARAYLAAFTARPSGEDAPEALYRLGASLADVGQVPDACVTLAEVGVRFPQSGFVAEAAEARTDLGCP